MKFIENIPDTQAERLKKRASLTRTRKALTRLCLLCAVIAIIVLIAALVILLTIELKENSESVHRLLVILASSLAGGAVAMGGAAFGFGALSQNATVRELDFCERCDSETSFYVGDGFLATFLEKELEIHSERGAKSVKIPYDEMRFFSVCERKLPREKGEWRVVLEIPSHYLTEKKKQDGDKPALVQTDGKTRLYECLKERGLELLGELPKKEVSKEKFKPVKKFSRPDTTRRTRSLVVVIVGAVVVAGSIPLAIFYPALGAMLGVLGVFFAGRSLWSFTQAKSVLALYKEGIWWRESSNKQDSIFLKWEEIERVSEETVDGKKFFALDCCYGVCHLPYIEEALGDIRKLLAGEDAEA